MITDNEGNLVTSVSFKKNFIFDNIHFKKKMSKNNVLFSLSPQGKVNWAKHITGGSGFITGMRCKNLAVGKNGHIYIAGTMSGKNIFDGKTVVKTKKLHFGPGETLDDVCGFIAEYDKNGKNLGVSNSQQQE